MQIKTTTRYHLTPVRMALIHPQMTSVGEDVEKGNTHALLVRMQTGASIAENSMKVLQKIKNGTAL